MESGKNLLRKATDQLKSSKRIIIVIAIVLCVFITAFFIIRKSEKITFYPISSAVKIKPIIKMFSQKDYLNLTSYVDNIASTLSGNEKKLALFYKAESYFLQQKYSEAKPIFQQIADEFPQFWQANFRLACLLFQDKDFKNAEAYFDRVKIDLEEINYWKGFFYYQQNQFDKALPYFKKSLSYPDSIFYAAEILKDKNNGKESLTYYITLFEKYPEYKTRALTSIIDVYEKNKEYDNLIKYLEIHEKMTPMNLEIKKKKGMAYYAVGRKEDAYKTLSPIALIKKDPEIIRILAILATEMSRYQDAVSYYEKLELNRQEKKDFIEVLIKAKQYEKAALVLEKFRVEERIETVADLSEIFHKLIECYMQLDKIDNALKIATYLTTIEETADNFLMLAKIYKLLNNPQAYLASLQKATEKEPKYLDQFLESLIELGAPTQAMIVLENILRKNPYHEIALFYRAKLEYQRHESENAKTTLFTLVNLPPKDKKIAEEAGYMLGNLLIKEEQKDEAERIFRFALKANPDSIKCNLKLASLLIQKNNPKEAKQILEILKTQSLKPPLLAVTYDLLSSAEEKLGNYDKSSLYKRRALEYKSGRQ